MSNKEHYRLHRYTWRIAFDTYGNHHQLSLSLIQWETYNRQVIASSASGGVQISMGLSDDIIDIQGQELNPIAPICLFIIVFRVVRLVMPSTY